MLVTKADLGAPARRAAADVRGALSIAGSAADVALVSAQSGDGVAAAVDRIETLLDRPEFGAGLPARRSAKAAPGPSRGSPNRSDSSDLPRWRPASTREAPRSAAVLTLIERVRAALHENIKNI